MGNFKIQEDVSEMGYISPSEILQFVTEEEVYELVFGFKPKEYDYVKAPYREDEEAGCWFEYGTKGKLLFKDWAYGGRPLDCFDLVRLHFNLPNFYRSLDYVKKVLIQGKKITTKEAHKRKAPAKKKIKGLDIKFQTRNFDVRDKDFWQSYGITKQNLIDDKVFAVSRIILIYKDPKIEDKAFTVDDIGYAYAEAKSGKKKIYRPAQEGKLKFITNCTQDDVIGLNSLPTFGRQLTVTKSYKDWRVLKNQGLNTVGFQNEGMIPDYKILIDLISRFEEIIIFFDNDKAGLRASEKVLKIFLELKAVVRKVHLPIELYEEGVTDPSDYRKRKGKLELQSFLRTNKLLR